MLLGARGVVGRKRVKGDVGRRAEHAPRLPQPDETFSRWFVPPSTPKKIVPRAQREQTPFGEVCGCLKGLSLGELGGVVMSSSSIGFVDWMDRRRLFEDGRDNFPEPFCT